MISKSLIIILSIVGLVQAWDKVVTTGPRILKDTKLEACGVCDQTKCVKPIECKAGLALDRCDCCTDCGLEESHLCNLDTDIYQIQQGLSDKPWHGRCSHNMECRERTDVDSRLVGVQSICFCKFTGQVCASDGNTYTHCVFEASASNSSITKISDGPCKTKPKVVVEVPRRVIAEGEKVTVICEATSYPRGEITWFLSRPRDGGKMKRMPSASDDVTVSIRGGDAESRLTSYLQITNFKLEHEGDYQCVVENEFGVAHEKFSLVKKV